MQVEIRNRVIQKVVKKHTKNTFFQKCQKWPKWPFFDKFKMSFLGHFSKMNFLFLLAFRAENRPKVPKNVFFSVFDPLKLSKFLEGNFLPEAIFAKTLFLTIFWPFLSIFPFVLPHAQKNRFLENDPYCQNIVNFDPFLSGFLTPFFTPWSIFECSQVEFRPF